MLRTESWNARPLCCQDLLARRHAKRRVRLERLDTERVVDFVGIVNVPVFDDQPAFPDRGNVGCRIAVDQIEIGTLSRRDRPLLSLESQETSPTERGHAEHGGRGTTREYLPAPRLRARCAGPCRPY